MNLFRLLSFKNSLFERNINHTNDIYGGFNPAVSNVYFTHGSLDPWHRMGVLNDLNKNSPSTVIPGISKRQSHLHFYEKNQLLNNLNLYLQEFRIVEIWAR